jgi:hypothetical protein
VTLEAMPDPDGVPAPVRLKRLLKIASRSLHLRCLAVQEIKPPAHAAPGKAAEKRMPA